MAILYYIPFSLVHFPSNRLTCDKDVSGYKIDSLEYSFVLATEIILKEIRCVYYNPFDYRALA